MHKNSAYSSKNKKFLWMILILLTLSILHFPSHLVFKYDSLEAPLVFGQKLPLFGFLFVIWACLLWYLAIFDCQSRSKGMMLVIFFGMVFLGFWVRIAPYGGMWDSIFNVAHIVSILRNGHIEASANFPYMDFPGLHILGGIFSLILGLEDLSAAFLLTLWSNVALLILLYCMMLQYLGTPSASVLAVLLAMEGNIIASEWASTFTPYMFGLVFFVALLEIAIRTSPKELWNRKNDMLVVITLFSAIAISHFVTSLLLIFTSLIWLSRTTARNKWRDMLRISLLYIIIISAWQIYHVGAVLTTFLKIILPRTLSDILNGLIWGSIPQMSASHFSIPFWAYMTRMFWVFFLLGGASQKITVDLLLRRKLDRKETSAYEFFLGVVFLTVFLTLLSPYREQYFRFFVFAPFIAAPVMVQYMSERRRCYYALVFLALLMVLPSFLAYNRTICTAATYPRELFVGQYICGFYGTGEGLVVFADRQMAATMLRSLPSACFVRPYEYRTESELWQELKVNLLLFKNHGLMIFGMAERLEVLDWYHNGSDLNYLYVFPVKLIFLEGTHIFGIDPEDNRWVILSQTLYEENVIYNEGRYQIFHPRS